MLNILLMPAFLLLANGLQAQQPAVKDSFSVTGGKWITCVDTTLSKNYVCVNPYTGFEFLPGGVYREYPKTMTDPTKKYLQGKWNLNKNEFTLDQDDEPGTKEMPKTYLVMWTDKDHFYASNKDGKAGPPVYVYFQRVK